MLFTGRAEGRPGGLRLGQAHAAGLFEIIIVVVGISGAEVPACCIRLQAAKS